MNTGIDHHPKPEVLKPIFLSIYREPQSYLGRAKLGSLLGPLLKVYLVFF